MEALNALNQYLIDIQHPAQMSTLEWIVTVILSGIAGGIFTACAVAGWYMFDPKKTHDVS